MKLLLFLIFISTNLLRFAFSKNTYFSNCSESFSCGHIQNLTYPFWGKNRPSYCGRPEFEVHCFNHDVPIITISSQKYIILTVIPETHELRIARADYYYDSVCPLKFENITGFHSAFFEFSTPPSYLTLYYGCPFPSSVPLDATPRCNVNNTQTNVLFSYGEYIPDDNNSQNVSHSRKLGVDVTTLPISRPVQRDEPKQMSPYKGCKYAVRVPILETLAAKQEATKASALEALHKGFKVKWLSDEFQCENCTNSGGDCGWDRKQKTFTCFCPGRLYPNGSKCLARTERDAARGADPPTNQNLGKSTGKKKTVIIGLVIGGVSLLALVIFSSLLIQRRRRRLFSQAQSRDLGLGPAASAISSRNGYHYSQDFTTSPSTNLSRSNPSSYPSSKSDLESASFYYGVKVFSSAELEEATDNFNESRELGDGGFGTVYYGKLRDGRLVAVKRLYESSSKRMGQFMNEIEILARLRHDYLVTLHGCSSIRSKELLLVYEYISNGTVADHLHAKLTKSSNNFLPWLTRLSIAVQTAEALTFLHKSDVVHRDVKTTNILLDSDFQVKVADFGLSRLFPTDVTHVSTAPQGTPGYVDPEYYKCYQLTEKSDVYSFGVVLVELISSKPAVDITRHRHDINLSNMAIDRIRNNTVHELVDPNLGYERDYAVQKMVKLMAEVAFQCLQEDREMRPCMEEVLKSLRAIYKEKLNSEKQVVVDIQEIDDDVSLLKNAPPPLSPETNEANDKGFR